MTNKQSRNIKNLLVRPQENQKGVFHAAYTVTNA